MISASTGELVFMGLVCAFVGVLATAVTLSGSVTSNDTLHKVGIDRIERCHNVHSNWYEIVWTKDANQDKTK